MPWTPSAATRASSILLTMRSNFHIHVGVNGGEHAMTPLLLLLPRVFVLLLSLRWLYSEKKERQKERKSSTLPRRLSQIPKEGMNTSRIPKSLQKSTGP